MNHSRSLARYRAIDLGFLGFFMILTQGIIAIAASTIYADQLYVVSTVGAVTALVLMRWNGWAAIHAVLGGAVHVFLCAGGWQQLVIYCGGNALSMLALLLMRWIGKEKIRSDALMAMFFGLCVQGLMLLGRAAVALVLGYPSGACISFITTDALSILFTVCIIWVCRRVEGLFEDQITYLLRTQDEAKAERRNEI